MKNKHNTNGIKIEKNIPIPPARGVGLTETLRKMEVGDSIIWEHRSNCHAVVKQAGLKIKLASRTVDGQLRVWRTE